MDAFSGNGTNPSNNRCSCYAMPGAHLRELQRYLACDIYALGVARKWPVQYLPEWPANINIGLDVSSNFLCFKKVAVMHRHEC